MTGLEQRNSPGYHVEDLPGVTEAKMVYSVLLFNRGAMPTRRMWMVNNEVVVA